MFYVIITRIGTVYKLKNETPRSKQSKETRFISPWLAYPLAIIVWWVIPWGISLVTIRHGWVAGHPAIWNLLGLIPVLIGTIGLLWGVSVHSAQSPEGLEWELDKSYLLVCGMYAFSRHPMYLSELILMMGWVIFYANAALLVAFGFWYLFFNFYQIPLEEKILEARFGETYRDYKKKTPRLFGKLRR